MVIWRDLGHDGTGASLVPHPWRSCRRRYTPAGKGTRYGPSRTCQKATLPHQHCAVARGKSGPGCAVMKHSRPSRTNAMPAAPRASHRCEMNASQGVRLWLGCVAFPLMFQDSTRCRISKPAMMVHPPGLSSERCPAWVDTARRSEIQGCSGRCSESASSAQW